MIKWLYFLFARFLTDKQVEDRYAKAGSAFGYAVSLIYMGECVGFAAMLAKWEGYETEYSRRGYRTFSMRDFVDLGGYRQPIKDLGAKRAGGEKAVLHAAIYRRKYLHKVRPVIDFAEMMKSGKPQLAVCALPNTEQAE